MHTDEPQFAPEEQPITFAQTLPQILQLCVRPTKTLSTVAPSLKLRHNVHIVKKQKTKKQKSEDTSPQELGSLEESLSGLRQSIDSIDNQLISLLNQRACIAQEVGAAKALHKKPAYAPARERALLQSLGTRNTGPLPTSSVRLIFKEIISASLALEAPLEVSFLGPEATFTHAATKLHFGLSARLQPRRTIPEVFDDVERGRCAYGVVPIENSTEGIVNHTLDSFMRSELTIGAEVLMQVSHHLLRRVASLRGITKVYSHPQALAQCRSWLLANLKDVTLVDVSSTARAAQMAAEDECAAAIASDLAASLYGLQVAASQLEEVAGNLTRFLVIGKEQPKPTGDDRTSLMFALKDEPGILYRALSHFAASGLNLSRIESRPSRRRAFDYLFFVDLNGHVHNDAVRRAVDGLKTTCDFVKLLGSYPAGTLEH